MVAARTGPEKKVSGPMPEKHAALVSKIVEGRFRDADSVHKGSGNAVLYRLKDGRHILRLDRFRVTNGPDLRVLLSAHPNPANSSEAHQGYVDLGRLKGNIGSQNYVLPADIDATRFRSVIVYCRAFGVIFSVAPLG